MITHIHIVSSIMFFVSSYILSKYSDKIHKGNNWTPAIFFTFLVLYNYFIANSRFKITILLNLQSCCNSLEIVPIAFTFYFFYDTITIVRNIILHCLRGRHSHITRFMHLVFKYKKRNDYLKTSIISFFSFNKLSSFSPNNI